jgi:hypothetical protein
MSRSAVFVRFAVLSQLIISLPDVIAAMSELIKWSRQLPVTQAGPGPVMHSASCDSHDRDWDDCGAGYFCFPTW